MFNREVKLHIYTALLSVLLIIAYQVNARGTGKHDANGTTRHADTGYESYENYLPAGKPKVQPPKKTESENQKPPAGMKKKKSDTKKKFILYPVRRGDTITKIAKKFSLTAEAICSSNHLKNENFIKRGTVLKIPLKTKSPPDGGVRTTNNKNRLPKNERPKFRWPLPHVVEYKRDGYNGVKSIGIIIIGDSGSSVVPSAPGVVRKIGRMRGFGKYVVVNHPGRFTTVYSNLSEITVSEGDSISGKNMIGKIDGPDKRLHFQIDFEGKPQNPLKYLPDI